MPDQWMGKAIARRAQLFLVYTLVLFVSFSFDVYNTVEGFRSPYIGFDSYIILNRLKLAAEGVPLWYPPGSYLSQFGLQAALLGGLMKATALEPIRFAYLAAYACTLLTAGVLAVFFVAIARSFGSVTSHVSVTLTALSPTLLAFAPSIYWCTFLLLAPFVVTWVAYPSLARSTRGYLLLLLILMLLVTIKALCGYEYITTLVLSPLVAAVYHQGRAGEPWRRRLIGLSGMIGAGCLGFAAAMLLHAAQIGHYLHRGGFEIILNRARDRTYMGNPKTEMPVDFGHTIFAWLPASIEHPLNSFFHYFTLPALRIPGVFSTTGPEISIQIIAYFALALMLWWAARRGSMPESLRGLVPALALSLVTSLSWQMVAINHMCVHFHLNTIVFHVPFLLLAYVGVGCAAQWAASRLRVAGVLDAIAIPAWMLLATVIGVSCLDARLDQKAADFKARQRVLLRLARGDAPVSDPGVLGYLDQVSLRPREEWTFEMNRSDLVRPVDGERGIPQEVVVSGWAFDPKAPRSRKVVVIRRGETFIEGEAVYFDRPDVKAFFKHRVPKCGFVVTTSHLRADDRERTRVFVVTGRDFGKVIELKWQ